MKIFGDLRAAHTAEQEAAPDPPGTESRRSAANVNEQAPAPRLVEDFAEPSNNHQPAADEVSAATQHYASAVRFYLRGQLDQALEELLKAREAGEDMAEVSTAMAQIYLEAGDFEKAAEAYRELVSLDTANGAAQFNLGLALEAIGRYEEARDAFAAAVEHDRELSDAYLGLAGASLNLKDLEGAKRAYHAYLKFDPEAYTAIFGLGVAHQLGEDHQGAVQYYLKALELSRSRKKCFRIWPVFTASRSSTPRPPTVSGRSCSRTPTR